MDCTSANNHIQNWLSLGPHWQMLPIRPNYLQRPVQAPPKFKTFQMDKGVNKRESMLSVVPTSLVTIPNFKVEGGKLFD